MERLTKRTPSGVAYMAIADTLSKRDQELEGSKPILEGLYTMFQKLADFEDREVVEKSNHIKPTLVQNISYILQHYSMDLYNIGYAFRLQLFDKINSSDDNVDSVAHFFSDSLDYLMSSAISWINEQKKTI